MTTTLGIPDPDAGPIPRGWAKQCLAIAREIGEVPTLKQGTDELQGHVAYYRKRGQDVTELMAAMRYIETRIGELLGAGERGNPNLRVDVNSPSDGLPHQLRHELRRLAWHDGKPVIDIAIEAVENGKLSRGAVLRYIDEHTHQPRPGAPDIRAGDFRQVLANLEPDSIDLVLTDPPYAAEYLPLWTDLAMFAADKLKPGGSLLAYSGQGNLPDVIARLGAHLRYWWTLALEHAHGSQNLPGKFVTIGWKPVLWYVKDTRRDHAYLADRLTGSNPRTTLHEWGQGRDELAPLIRTLTATDDLIVDPFAGSGTTGHAALTLGRRFVGADIREAT